MIIKTLLEGVKSEVWKGLVSPPTPSPLHIWKIAISFLIGAVSLLISDVFLGLALYKTLILDYQYRESISLLMTGFFYFLQAGICLIFLRRTIKKVSHESIFVKDYRLVKNVISSLVSGYKSK